MFGLSIVQPDSLSTSDAQFLGRIYCGICSNLRGNFGEFSGFLVNYDARFIALLSIAQSEEIDQEKVICPFKGYIGQQEIIYNKDIMNFASAITMLLFHEKLMDNIRDENSLISFISSTLVSDLWQQKTYELLSNLSFPIHNIREAQLQHLESENHFIDIRTYLEPTASFLGDVFAFTSILSKKMGNNDILRNLGKTIGRLVVLIDSIEDLNNDKRGKKFNPFIKHWGLTSDFFPISFLAELCVMIAEQFCNIDTFLSQIPFTSHISVIDNILSRGLPHRAAMALSRLWHTNHWIGYFPFLHYESLGFRQCQRCDHPHLLKSTIKWDLSMKTSLWSACLTLPNADTIFRELGLKSIEEYMLVCMFPAFLDPSTK